MMVAQLLSSAKFCEFLFTLDFFLFEAVKKKRCLHCGGVLHTANYKRKVFGNGIATPAVFEIRLAACCSWCRKRCFVPSIRFFERRGACALHFLLALLFLQKPSARNLSKLKKMLPISSSTIARWREYFIEKFPELASVKKLNMQHVINRNWFIKFFMRNSLGKASLILLSLLLVDADNLYKIIAAIIAGNITHAKDG